MWPPDRQNAQSTAGIQTLLEAEKDAQNIVEKARQYRTQRVKDARSEAQKEIENYKATKEKAFKSFESDVGVPVYYIQAANDQNSGANDKAEDDMKVEVNDRLEEIKKSVADGKSVIVKNVLAAIVKADPQMHMNAVKVWDAVPAALVQTAINQYLRIGPEAIQ